eukprot:g53334.t1
MHSLAHKSTHKYSHLMSDGIYVVYSELFLVVIYAGLLVFPGLGGISMSGWFSSVKDSARAVPSSLVSGATNFVSKGLDNAKSALLDRANDLTGGLFEESRQAADARLYGDKSDPTFAGVQFKMAEVSLPNMPVWEYEAFTALFCDAFLPDAALSTICTARSLEFAHRLLQRVLHNRKAWLEESFSGAELALLQAVLVTLQDSAALAAHMPSPARPAKLEEYLKQVVTRISAMQTQGDTLILPGGWLDLEPQARAGMSGAWTGLFDSPVAKDSPEAAHTLARSPSSSSSSSSTSSSAYSIGAPSASSTSASSASSSLSSPNPAPRHRQQVSLSSDGRQIKGQVCVYVVDRLANGKFRFAIINPGNGLQGADLLQGALAFGSSGLQFHSSRVSEDGRKIKKCPWLVIEQIPQEKLADSAFWLLLCRLQFFPSEHCVRRVYEELLPYLGTFRSAPPPSDHSYRSVACRRSLFRPVLLALRYTLLARGFGPDPTRYLCLILKTEMCSLLAADLTRLRAQRSATGHRSGGAPLRRSARRLVDLACRQLAYSVSKHAEKDVLQDSAVGAGRRRIGLRYGRLEELTQLLETISRRADALRCTDHTYLAAVPPPLRLLSSSSSASLLPPVPSLLSKPAAASSAGLSPACFPLFDRVLRVLDVEPLAGQAKPHLEIVPVPISLVLRVANSLAEVENALRHTERLCGLLAYQSHLISNSHFLRVALIQDLFTSVVPMPLPLTHPKRGSACLWAQPMRYETQLDMLRLLRQVAQHFLAAAFSLPLTRSFDAARILTLAAIACLADVVIHSVACDIPSELCVLLAGGGGGGGTYGFNLGFFSEQSEEMQFCNPKLAATRGQVLDYFAAQRLTLQDKHLIFPFETTMSLTQPCSRLLNTLSCSLAWPVEEKDFGYLFTGENPLLVASYPEFEYYRDLVFLFKFTMTPTSHALPEFKQWLPMDARLSWRYTHTLGVLGSFVVTAFNDKSLVCCVEQGRAKESILYQGLSMLRRIFVTERRVPPSAGNPSALCQNHTAHPDRLKQGELLENEDDVLYVPQLPEFASRLLPSEAELLLSYLTVPYIRLPLVLSFFASEDKIQTLACPLLRAVLDAVFFEAGRWEHPRLDGVAPATVPSKDKALLASPCGALFNELVHNPQGLLEALKDLVNLALDLNPGKYTGTMTSVILYAIRLTVRVEHFLLYLLRYNRRIPFDHSEELDANLAAPAGAPHGPDLADLERHQASGSNFGDRHVRGLRCGGAVLDELHAQRKYLRALLNGECWRTLDKWCAQATAAQDERSTCVFHAHQLMLFAHLPAAELTASRVTGAIASLVLLTTRWDFTASAKAQAEANQAGRSVEGGEDWLEGQQLAIPATELFDLLQGQRHNLLDWLGRSASASQRSEVLDAVVRVATFTGSRQDPANGDENHLNLTRLLAGQSHGWKELRGRGRGRFFPSYISLTHKREIELAAQRDTGNSEKTEGKKKKADDMPMLEDDVEAADRQVADKAGEESKTVRDGFTTPPKQKDRTASSSSSSSSSSLSSSSASSSLQSSPVRPSERPASPVSPPSPSIYDDSSLVRSSEQVKMEINLQTGEFTLRTSQITALPAAIRAQPDVVSVFGADLQDRIQAAEVRNTTKREWIRLVGRRHDLQIWQPDTRRLQLARSFSRQASSSSLHPHEKWILDGIEVLKEVGLFEKLGEALYLPAKTLPQDAVLARLAARLRGPGSPVGGSLKEIVMWKRTLTVHVYDLLEHGRYIYRSLAWTSDARYCFKALQPTLDPPELWLSLRIRHAAGCGLKHIAPARSVVITRNLKLLVRGVERLIPSRLLCGLLPDALLQAYQFWQQEHDQGTILVGQPRKHPSTDHPEVGDYTTDAEAEEEPRSEEEKKKEKRDAILVRLLVERPQEWEEAQGAELKEAVNAEGAIGMGEGGVVARVTRGEDIARAIFAFAATNPAPTVAANPSAPSAAASSSSSAASSPFPSPPLPAPSSSVLTLLNLVGAHEASELACIADLFTRLETLSHILAWSRGDRYDRVDLLELPRLGLTFVRKLETDESLLDHGRSKEAKEGAELGRVPRLHCEQHSGLFVSDAHLSSDAVRAQLAGLPHALLLQNSHQELFILLPALLPVRPGPALWTHHSAEAHLSTEIVFARDANSPRAKEWRAAFRNKARAYIIPVHLSRGFLVTTTLAATLYLFLCRFLDRQYVQAFKLAELCVSDSALSREESAIFEQLDFCGDDVSPDAAACRLKLSLSLLDSLQQSNQRGGYREEEQEEEEEEEEEDGEGGEDGGQAGVAVWGLFPWSLAHEYARYIRLRSHVDANCRLHLREERTLLDLLGLPAAPAPAQCLLSAAYQDAKEAKASLVKAVGQATAAVSQAGSASEKLISATTAISQLLWDGEDQIKLTLRNRSLWLCAVIAAAEQSSQGKQPAAVARPEFLAPVPYMTPSKEQFDSVEDKTCLSVAMSALSKLNLLKYSRPSSRAGAAAVTYLNQVCDKGITLHGTAEGLGFLFLYELLTGGLSLSVLPGDQPHRLVELLCRSLPYSDRQSKSVFMSTLRVLVRNPVFAASNKLPAYRNVSSGGTTFLSAVSGGYLFAGSTSFQEWLTSLLDAIRAHQTTLTWPAVAVSAPQPLSRAAQRHPIVGAPPCYTDWRAGPGGREWIVPELSDVACSSRRLRVVEEQLAQSPLSAASPASTLPVSPLDSAGADKPAASAPANMFSIGMSQNDIEAFQDTPLAPVRPTQLVVYRSRAARGLSTIDSNLPFDISHLPSAHSPVAQETLAHLKEDLLAFAKEENAGTKVELVGMGHADLEACLAEGRQGAAAKKAFEVLKTILTRLRNLHHLDSSWLAHALPHLLNSANHQPHAARAATRKDGQGSDAAHQANTDGEEEQDKRRLRFGLARLGRREPSVTLEFIAGALMSTQGQIDLRTLNPLLSEAEASRILDLAAAAMFRTVRLGQLNRCLLSVRSVLSDMTRHVPPNQPVDASSSIKNARVVSGLLAKTNNLAKLLSAQRHYVLYELGQVPAQSLAQVYDPRFLVFEFDANLLLRKRQVELVNEFASAARKKQAAEDKQSQHDKAGSIVHQMIMGAGKTTVVGPLLSLLLADGQRLVVLVTPPALLEFSRATLRARFSSVARKHVVTFKFSRGAPASARLVARLARTRKNRGVVITTPSAIKSLALALVEAEHLADVAASGKDSASLAKLSLYGHGYYERRAERCRRLLRCFQHATVLLDEVDLLLHPLKSELNFPVGAKTGLDLGDAASMGSDSDQEDSERADTLRGVRWDLPFHILNAVLVAAQGLRSITAPPSSPTQAASASSSPAKAPAKALAKAVSAYSSPAKAPAPPPKAASVYSSPAKAPASSAPVPPSYSTKTLTSAGQIRAPRPPPTLPPRPRAPHCPKPPTTPPPKASHTPAPPSTPPPANCLSSPGGAAAVGARLAGAAAREQWVSAVGGAGGDGEGVGLEASQRAKAVLARLRSALWTGLQQRWLQSTPHLVLLDPAAYRSEIASIIIDWVMIFLDAKHVRLDTQIAKTFLAGHALSEGHANKFGSLQQKDRKLLNFARDWCLSFLPHVLSKIDRVSFGLLNAEDLARALQITPRMPKSREVMAVPFVGKDVPSRAAEFAQPDVVIGLTILAYRYEGLRKAEFTALLTRLKERMMRESGPLARRPTSKLFARWVQLANGKIRQYSRQQAEIAMAARARGNGSRPNGNGPWPIDQDELAEWWDGDAEKWQSPPLRLLEFEDEEVLNLLWSRLKCLPALLYSYLTSSELFPAQTRQQRTKLSANGVCLGGEMIFGEDSGRLGFSGTPSSLIPRELGDGICHFERGTDARLLHVLTDPSVVSVRAVPPGWSVNSLLDMVAGRRRRPGAATGAYNALIDSGALITGLGNLEVARELLSRGLPHVDGVVYLDGRDRKMVLVRTPGLPASGWPVLPIEQCGIALKRRFAFYDQIHTTGMDIQHCLDATAALTLGKDMSWRDYAQGAYRMRGIGHGQSVEILLVPEVVQLIRSSFPSLSIPHFACDPSSPGSAPAPPRTREFLQLVAGWLTGNGFHAQRLQQSMLCLQDLRNIWRKQAFRYLLRGRAAVDSPGRTGRELSCAHKQIALQVFREPVGYTVSAQLPRHKGLLASLDAQVKSHAPLASLLDVSSAFDRATLARCRSVAQQLQHSEQPSATAHSPESRARELEAEKVQEREQEQEEENEIENEIEQEVQQETVIEEYKKMNYVREQETPVHWTLEALAMDPRSPSSLSALPSYPFYPLSKFQLYGARELTLPSLPDFCFVSQNYFKPSWWRTAHHRLKHVVAVLEWIPDQDLLAVLPASPERDQAAQSAKELSSEQRERIQEVFDLFDTEQSGYVSLEDFTQLLQILDVQEHSELLAARIDNDGDGRFSFNEVCQMFRTGAHMSMQQGRYFLLLSLAEAETLVRILHLARAFRPPEHAVQANQGRPIRHIPGVGGLGQLFEKLNKTQLGMWNNRKTYNLVTPPLALLGTSCRLFPASSMNQLHTAMQAFRFLNSDCFYHAPHLRLLLNTLQPTPPAVRQRWFMSIRAHRRRQQDSWEWAPTPLARLFTQGDQLHLLAHRARLAKIRQGLAAHDLYAMDVFRAFDADKDGKLSARELEHLFQKLAIPLAFKDAQALIAARQPQVARLGDGAGLREQDWKTLLREDRGLATFGSSPTASPDKPAHDASKGSSAGQSGSQRAEGEEKQSAEHEEQRVLSEICRLRRAQTGEASPAKAKEQILQAEPVRAKSNGKAESSAAPPERKGKGTGRPEAQEGGAEHELDSWACTACTFANAGPLLSCEMCGAARPIEDSSGAQPASPDAKQGSSSPRPAAAAAVASPRPGPLQADVAAWTRPSLVEMVRSLRVSVLPVRAERLQCVWTSKGTRSQGKSSVWRHAPLPPGPLFPRPPSSSSSSASASSSSSSPSSSPLPQARTRVRLVLGSYAGDGYSPPSHAQEVWLSHAGGAPTACLSDEFVDLLAPHPIDFQLVWQHRTGRALYVWKPVPPSSLFTALGMVCSTQARKPQVKAVRCVPVSWLRALPPPPMPGTGAHKQLNFNKLNKFTPRAFWEKQSAAAPAAGERVRKVWSHAPADGAPGSLWVLSSLGLLHGTMGYNPPHAPDKLELKAKTFQASVPA